MIKMRNFSIQFTGVGGAFSRKHYNNGLLIEINGKKYLLDCGMTIFDSLEKLNVDVGEIEGVIISHIHSDHVGGLELFGQLMMFKYQKKPKLFVSDDLVGPIWNNCLSGGMEDITDEKTTLESYFNVVVFKNEEIFTIEKLQIRPIKTIHVPNPRGNVKPCYSFIFDDRMFFSADSLINYRLLNNIGDEMEVIFHDCQLFSYPGAVHASIDELETLPQHLKNKVKVMHYGDNFEEFEERIRRDGFERVKQFQKFEF